MFTSDWSLSAIYMRELQLWWNGYVLMPRGANRPSICQFGSARCAFATWLGVDHLCVFQRRMVGGLGRCRSATMMSSMATESARDKACTEQRACDADSGLGTPRTDE